MAHISFTCWKTVRKRRQRKIEICNINLKSFVVSIVICTLSQLTTAVEPPHFTEKSVINAEFMKFLILYIALIWFWCSFWFFLVQCCCTYCSFGTYNFWKKKEEKNFCHFFVKKSLKCVNKGQEWATIHLR